MSQEIDTLFDRVGGFKFFTELVERFYQLVEVDLILRPLYPVDLQPGKRYLASFLAQYWGGPPHYSMERGHPRLRLRHLPFPIGQLERDAWVTCMMKAIRSLEISDADALLMIGYFESTATWMINQE